MTAILSLKIAILRLLVRALPLFLLLTVFDWAKAQTPLIATQQGSNLPPESITIDGGEISVWKTSSANKELAFHPPEDWTAPPQGPLYLSVTYLDRGYGILTVSYRDTTGKDVKPDKFSHIYLLDSGKLETAYFRLTDAPLTTGLTIQVGRDRGDSPELVVSAAILSDTPFPDAHFRYILDEPWKRPYDGPTVPPPDNTTLKGKVMVGYQGWFRTPNDPSNRGWVHWGDMSKPLFTTDMWPDISQYPPETLDKACDVKTLSGKTAYLFSSTWPEVAQTQFRWMRENNIDGAFVQRFAGDNWAINKTPQWVLGAVREAANQEGRIWAIEYDLSGLADDQALDHMQKDWSWLVDDFGLFKDANYARVAGKPVVFLWGPGVSGRKLTPDTTAKLIDYFKNDPKYGGNYVILGGPGNWKQLGSQWLDTYKKADGILGWMSQDYAGDLAQCRAMGIDYYPHVWPGFSWANLKHIETGSTVSYTPRNGGRVYEERFSKAAAAGVDRLFVGMYDEYDESTAIIPMSDDPPPTVERPGTVVKFYADPKLQETGTVVVYPQVQMPLDGTSPAKGIPGTNFFMRWEGTIIAPEDGNYTFSIEGAPDDSASLWFDEKKVLEIGKLGEEGGKSVTIPLTSGKRVIFRLESQHGSGSGTFQLVWQGPNIDRQPVPASALIDAWGRFITNEGHPPDLYLKLTGEARDMINGKRSPTDLSTTAN